MRKITLMMATFFVAVGAYAQQTISFEAAEGFTLGNINTQNGWASTGDGQGGFVSNQVVSDEQSTNGTQSLKITTESAFGGQANPVVGGFYTYAAPVDYTDAVVSYDIYIEQEPDGNDYRFGVTGTGTNDQGQPATFFVALVDFNFQNNIRVVNNAGTFENVSTWASDTWYNVRMEFNNSQVEYFVDDVSVGTFDLLNELDLTGARIVHDNFGGLAYFDNFRTNDENLSNDQFVAENDFLHYVNNHQLYLESSTSLSGIEIYNISGKRIVSQELTGSNNAQTDIQMLDQGIYIARLTTEAGVHSFKFAK